MAFDLGLLLGQPRRWRGCIYRSMPSYNTDPVIWADADGSIWVWHPILNDSICMGDRAAVGWTQEDFTRFVTDKGDAIRRSILLIIEDVGLEPNFYSMYPNTLRQIDQGDMTWMTTEN